MIRIAVLLLFISSVSFSWAQNNAAGDLIPNEFDFLLYAQEMANKPGKKLYLNQLNDYSNIDGSPFWFKEELIAQVVQMNGDRINNVPILFDQFKREILAKSKNGQIILLEEAMYNEITITRGISKDIFRKVHPTYPHRFYQVLFEDEDKNLTVFKDIDVQLNESASSYVGINDKIREFRRRTNYYIRTPQEIKKVAFKKKKFYDSFSKEEADKLKAFAKKQKFKLKEEKEFLALIDFLYG